MGSATGLNLSESDARGDRQDCHDHHAILGFDHQLDEQHPSPRSEHETNSLPAPDNAGPMRRTRSAGKMCGRILESFQYQS